MAQVWVSSDCYLGLEDPSFPPFVLIFILHVCSHPYHLHAWCPWSLVEAVGSPGTGVKDGCELSKHQVLLIAELSLQPKSLKFSLFYVYVCMNVCVCVYSCTYAHIHSVHGEVKGQLVRVSALLPPSRSCGWPALEAGSLPSVEDSLLLRLKSCWLEALVPDWPLVDTLALGYVDFPWTA